MAITVKIFTAKNIATLVDDVNAYLAPLVGVDSPIIRKLDLSLQDAPERLNQECRVLLQIESGGVSVPTPWELTAVQAAGPSQLESAIQDAIDADAAYFWGGPVMEVVDNALTGKFPLYVAIMLSNAQNDADTEANYDLR